MIYGGKHGGIINLSPKMILNALNFPRDTSVIGAEWEFESGNIRLYLNHHDLPVIFEGERYPVIMPKWSFEHKEIVKFGGW